MLTPIHVLNERPGRTGVRQTRMAPRARFWAGELVTIDPGRVLTITQGVIAQRIVHPDGAESLLGLHGPGCVLVVHAADDCNIQLMAHTDAVIEHAAWEEVAGRPDFAVQLRLMLERLEAWNSAQARPSVAARLLAVLSLLAQAHGVVDPRGSLIDLRLTHAVLASAVRATRTTVTRALLKLRQDGLVFTEPAADGERLGLATSCFEKDGPDCSRPCLPTHSCHAHLHLSVR